MAEAKQSYEATSESYEATSAALKEAVLDRNAAAIQTTLHSRHLFQFIQLSKIACLATPLNALPTWTDSVEKKRLELIDHLESLSILLGLSEGRQNDWAKIFSPPQHLVETETEEICTVEKLLEAALMPLREKREQAESVVTQLQKLHAYICMADSLAEAPPQDRDDARIFACQALQHMHLLALKDVMRAMHMEEINALKDVYTQTIGDIERLLIDSAVARLTTEMEEEEEEKAKARAQSSDARYAVEQEMKRAESEEGELRLDRLIKEKNYDEIRRILVTQDLSHFILSGEIACIFTEIGRHQYCTDTIRHIKMDWQSAFGSLHIFCAAWHKPALAKHFSDIAEQHFPRELPHQKHVETPEAKAWEALLKTTDIQLFVRKLDLKFIIRPIQALHIFFTQQVAPAASLNSQEKERSAEHAISSFLAIFKDLKARFITTQQIQLIEEAYIPLLPEGTGFSLKNM